MRGRFRRLDTLCDNTRMSSDVIPAILPPSSDALARDSSAQCNGKSRKRTVSAASLAAIAAHRWKPGQSGNPGGRTAKPISDKMLAKLVAHKGKVAGAIAEAAIRKAMDGDIAAFCAITDRIEGKPVQRVEGDQAIHITVTRIGD